MRKPFTTKLVSVLIALSLFVSCTTFCHAGRAITTPDDNIFAFPKVHLDMALSSDGAFVPDLSGEGYDAMVTGTPEEVSGPSEDSTALDFPGYGKHLKIANPSGLDFSGDYAISVTFKLHVLDGNDQMLVIKRDRSKELRDFQLNINSSKKLNFLIRNADDTWTSVIGSTPTTGEWHTAVAKVEDNVMSLYLDGALEASTTITKARQATTSAPISIGADSLEGTHPAYAAISDVKIAIPDGNTPVREYFAPTVTPDIHMEMDSENLGKDATVNDNDASIKGTLTKADGYAEDDTALQFGYYTGMYFTNLADMDFSNDFSIEATFMSTDSSSSDKLIVCKRKRSVDQREFQLFIASGKIKLILRNSSDSWVHCEGPAVTVNEWHTVVATVKDNVIQLYLDGVLANTVVNTAGRMPANTSPVFIGADPEGGEGFIGRIAEVKISDEAAKYPAVKFTKDSTPDVRTMAVGEYVFSDRVEDGYIWRDVMPDFFKGKKYNYGSIQGGIYEVQSGGLIYALTPDSTLSGTASQEVALTTYGFTRLSGLDFQCFGWSGINYVHAYCKQAMPGDVYEIGKWAIIVADDMTIESTDYIDNWGNNTGEVLYNGITLPEVWPPKNLDKYSGEMPVPYLNSKPAVININTGRQLFVDDFLIESTSLTRKWHKAQKYEGNPVMEPETEQELGRPYAKNPSQTYGSVAAPFSGGVWYDSNDGLYKMWYNAGWHDGTALATSKDGITWERAEYDVEPGTNLVIPHREGVRRDSSAVILDPFADVTERFKMFLWSRPIGGEVYTSADGIHWGKPTAVGSTGDRSTIFYNPFRDKWVYSIRSYWWGRARDYHECDDLIEGASLNGSVRWARVDSLDLKDPVINATPELYNLDAVAYESVMLGAFSILLGPTNEECYEVGLPKITELHMGFSRDGFHWSRSEDRTAFIGATQSDTWDRGYLHSNASICLVNDDELWFYYTAFEGNEEKKDESVYDSTVNGAYDKGRTGLATLRRDGFASMNTETSGTLTTEKVTFDGKYLFVNANAKSVKAEILDENGKVIVGYSANDCVAVSGDTTKAMLSFGKDLSSLSGKNVKFRFYVEDGEFYSFWVTDDAENGASNGYLAGGSVGQKGLVDTAESYTLLGDVNEDGEVSFTDAELVRKNILGDTSPINTSAADANKDGKINVCDLVAICNKADTE